MTKYHNPDKPGSVYDTKEEAKADAVKPKPRASKTASKPKATEE